MKTVEALSSNRLLIGFGGIPKEEFFPLLEAIKKLPDAKYRPKSKKWEVPNINHVRHSLKGLGFNVPEKKKTRITLSGYDERLFDFQVEGLRALESFNGRGLLAMEMGTGKTPTSINYLRMHPEKRPAIMVTPASVKLNWLKELGNWLPGNERPLVVSGRKPVYLHGYSLIVINYDILEAHTPALVKLNPKVAIVDEVQYAKNPKAGRTKALKALCKNIPHVIGLSGTPILNRPSEFWPILNITRPDVWSNKSSYMFRYCGPKRNPWSGGFDFKGATNTEELHQILNENIMYRVLKKDVLKDMPDKLYSVVPFGMTRTLESKYDKAVKNGNLNGNKITALALLGELRQIAWDVKKDQAVKWIRDVLEQGEKLVVFGVHHKVIDYLMAEFEDTAVKIDGRCSAKQKQWAIDTFQSDPNKKLLAGNIEAAGTGVDGLQNVCSNVAFLEFPWVPALVDQASDRLHRIGQKDTVNVYYLYAEGTIESDIVKLLDSKRAVLDSVLDGKLPDEESMISYLIDQLRRAA